VRNFLPVFTLLAALLSACAVSQPVSLEPDGAGTAVVHIKLEKIFTDYLKDLSEVSGGTSVPGGVQFRIPLLKVLLLDKPLDLPRCLSSAISLHLFAAIDPIYLTSLISYFGRPITTLAKLG
jgi:hypothetical protein